MIGGRASPADDELMRLESSRNTVHKQVKSFIHSDSFVAAPPRSPPLTCDRIVCERC